MECQNFPTAAGAKNAHFWIKRPDGKDNISLQLGKIHDMFDKKQTDGARPVFTHARRDAPADSNKPEERHPALPV